MNSSLGKLFGFKLLSFEPSAVHPKIGEPIGTFAGSTNEEQLSRISAKVGAVEPVGLELGS
jgi:hypothetical protein